MTEARTSVVRQGNQSISNDPHPELLLGHSNRASTDEERTILQDQLAEDMKDLEDLCSRIGRESAKIEEKNGATDKLRSSLESMRHQYSETSRQVEVELGVQRSMEQLSRDYDNSVTPSAFAADLQRINAKSVEESQAVIAKSIHGFQEARKREGAKVFHLEDSLKLEYVSLNLLLDRKAALEKQREELGASIQRKRALLGTIRHFSTKRLVQIFIDTVEMVIRARISNPGSVPNHPTLAIIAVCRRWREIALATTELWRYIPIYVLPPLDAYPQLPMPMRLIYERAMNSRDLFVDWTRSTDERSDRPMHRWSDVLKSMALPLTTATLDPRTTLTIFFSGESAMTMHVRFFVLEKFIFHNVYPDINRASAQHVRSIIMHFRERPKLKKIMATLRQFPNLDNLEVYFQGKPYREQLALGEYPSLPRLQSLSLRLSMVPLFLGRDHPISTSIHSLKVCFDVPSSVTFLSPAIWVAMVESSRLATSLRHLEIDESISLEHTTTYMAPLLLELHSVATLSLRGGFMSPILDVLSQDHTRLPSLYRLEMHSTDIAESVIETFFNSRRSSGQPAPVRIREVVFDHCSKVTREFCDRFRNSVDNLTVYC